MSYHRSLGHHKMFGSDYALEASLVMASIVAFLLFVTMVYGGFGSAMRHFRSLGNSTVYVITIRSNDAVRVRGFEATEPITYRPCDLDQNNACDGSDFAIFKKTLFTCSSDDGYSRLSDANGDGCVLGDDWQTLFPSYFAQ